MNECGVGTEACTEVPGTYIKRTRGWYKGLCSALHGTGWR